MGLSNYLPSSRISQSGVCTSSTRPASPYEGQVIYETDTNQVRVYDGSAWVMIADTDTPPGLELIKVQAFSATSTIATDVFTTRFEQYRVIIDTTNVSVTGTTMFQFASGGSPIATSDYYYGGSVFYYNTTSSYWASGPTTGFVTMIASGAVQTHAMIDISFPRSANRKQFTAQSTSNYSNYIGTTTHGICNLTASNYDGFKIYQDAGGTLTGTYKVYGYRNSI